MNIVEAVERIKKVMLDERRDLLNERNALSKRIVAGADFFSANKQYSRSELTKATEILRDSVNKLSIIDKKIFDLDVYIGTELEALLSDFEVRISTAKKMNDMNESVPSREFILSAYSDEEKVHINAEDLWALKILKPALKYCNIEISEKNDK